MTTQDIRTTIQQAYSQFLQSKGLKPRLGQKLMVAAIAKTLSAIEFDSENMRTSEQHVCVIEAGTGTGKTVAYFLAALPLAKALGKSLVVSTATVALQEQIVFKDLPDIRTSSGLDFDFTLVKGRGRYVCLAKLDHILNDANAGNGSQMSLMGETDFVQMNSVGSEEQTVKIYQSMMEALAQGKWNGEKDSWKGELDDQQWIPLTTNHRQCTGRRCSYVGQCSFFKSRDNLTSYDCIVTNHDLVLSDLALGGGAILPPPEECIFIFDEGHHLPDKALNHFSHYSRIESTLRWLDECQQNLAAFNSHVGAVGKVEHWLKLLPDAIDSIKKHSAIVQLALNQILEQDGGNDNQYRFQGGEISVALQNLAQEQMQLFDRLNDTFTHISVDMSEALAASHSDVPKVDIENWFPVIGAWLARSESVLALWTAYANADGDDDIPNARWLKIIDQDVGGQGKGRDIEVCVSPILASNVLDELLWQRCAAAVVTSATLTALGKFDRLNMRAGFPVASHMQVVPSPFDYSGVLLQIPPQATDASQAEQHTFALVDALPELLDIKQGNLVLFASRRQMQQVYEELPKEWQYAILIQDSRSKQEIITTHKQRIDDGMGSTIFGLASFAEGVDLPGDYCRHVMIAKIPFAVPDNPVDAALGEWIEAKGGNAFMEISVPDAALKLIQACGRLIRTESDTGTVTIMDRRLLTKRYGKSILNSLPAFKQRFS